MICETCAPESEKVTQVFGFFISSSASSWSSFASGWRKNSLKSCSSARSIIASIGATPRSFAISATERCGRAMRSMT